MKKKFPASACRKKKNCMEHKCNRKLMGKKGKNILPTRLLAKKILDDQKSLQSTATGRVETPSETKSASRMGAITSVCSCVQFVVAEQFL